MPGSWTRPDPTVESGAPPIDLSVGAGSRGGSRAVALELRDVTTTRVESMTAQSASRDKVIVIGCSLTGYAVIRALADKDVHIIAITYSRKDVAQLSR